VPTTGGIVIFFVFGVALLLGNHFCPGFPPALVGRMGVLLIGAALIAFLGAIDDHADLSPTVKLMAQSVIAASVVAGGFSVSEMRFLLGPTVHIGWLGYPLAFVWFMVFMNAMNLIDGLDGLAGGIAGLASLTLVAVALAKGNMLLFFTAAALLGATGGFLVHNFKRGSVYLGDAGSTGLGFLLAGIAIVGSDNDAASAAILAAGACMVVPVFDVFTTVVRRMKAGRNIMAADHYHVHHRLIGFGLSPKGVVLVLWGTTVFFAGQVLSIVIPNGIVFAVLGLGAGAAVGYVLLAQRRKNTHTSTSDVSDEIFYYLLGMRGHSDDNIDDGVELRSLIRHQIRREASYQRVRRGDGRDDGIAAEALERVAVGPGPDAEIKPD
jgi:UDP-GlcNAc:undecaprenyl-phosphate GlcNAc-1-phosphate transferase